LKMADLRGKTLEGPSKKGEGVHDVSVAVPLEDLGGDEGGLQSEQLADPSLYGGFAVGVGAHGTGYLSVADLLRGEAEPFPVAGELVMPVEQLEAEGRGFRMDAVGTAGAGNM